MEKEPRIRRFCSFQDFGRRAPWIAYAIDEERLPELEGDCHWKEDLQFSEEKELVNTSGARQLFEKVRKTGIEIITRE